MKYYGSVVKVKLDINLLTKNFRYHIRTNYWPQVPIQWSLTGGKVVKSPQKLQLWPIFTGGNIGFCLCFFGGYYSLLLRYFLTFLSIFIFMFSRIVDFFFRY